MVYWVLLGSCKSNEGADCGSLSTMACLQTDLASFGCDIGITWSSALRPMQCIPTFYCLLLPRDQWHWAVHGDSQRAEHGGGLLPGGAEGRCIRCPVPDWRRRCHAGCAPVSPAHLSGQFYALCGADTHLNARCAWHTAFVPLACTQALSLTPSVNFN